MAMSPQAIHSDKEISIEITKDRVTFYGYNRYWNITLIEATDTIPLPNGAKKYGFVGMSDGTRVMVGFIRYDNNKLHSVGVYYGLRLIVFNIYRKPEAI